jgi:hypothetical protein
MKTYDRAEPAFYILAEQNLHFISGVDNRLVCFVLACLVGAEDAQVDIGISQVRTNLHARYTDKPDNTRVT